MYRVYEIFQKSFQQVTGEKQDYMELFMILVMIMVIFQLMIY